MPTPVPAALLAAFNNAHYAVFAPEACFTLHIGRHSKPLARLMTQYGAHTAAILTAFNPQGVAASPDSNRDAQQSLLNSIDQLGLRYFNGENYAPEAHGHAEPTLAVLGMRREQACALAQQFRQLAFVFADSRATPELVWMQTETYLPAPASGR